jgi:nucleoside-diphosphate-sugar epimerase
MVIGNGLMAKTFSDYINRNDIIVFASGVSNSREINSLEFQREYDLLKETLKLFPEAKFIYFSTCSIEDEAVNEKPYVRHKLQLEDFIQSNAKDYLIFRISNVVGVRGNANTIMNYLVNCIKNSTEIPLWKYAERNLIDADDVKLIVNDAIKSGLNNSVLNVASRNSLSVLSIVKEIEKYLNLEAKINLLEKGNSLKIDTSQISPSLDKIEKINGIELQYIFNLLKKYY